MKKCLTLLFFAISLQVVAQTYPITGINISLPASPDANTANWGTGKTMLTITATAKAVTGRIDPIVEECKLLLTIKKGGNKVCGSYTGSSAPAANFNTLTKVWSGTNAVAFLGQDCILTPGDYEICVQFFGYGPAGVAPLSEEKCKPFTIKAIEQQTYQSPQPIAPADGTVFSNAALQKPMIFNWLPLMPKSQDPVTYRLTVWQLMQGQTGVQAMKANQPIITKDVDNITQAVITNLVSGPCKSPYQCAFVWVVQALNREGKPIGENNGTSKPSQFSANSCDVNLTLKLKSVECLSTTNGNNNYKICVSATYTSPNYNLTYSSAGSGFKAYPPSYSPFYTISLLTPALQVQNSGSATTVDYCFNVSVPAVQTAIKIGLQGDDKDPGPIVCQPGAELDIKLPVCHPTCDCGTWGPIMINRVKHNCGSKTEWKCNQPINFSDTYQCSPNNESCQAKTNWEVTRDGSGINSGSGTSGSFTPTSNGIYAVTLFANCNGKDCPTCTYTFVVSGCPPTCDCGKWIDGVVRIETGGAVISRVKCDGTATLGKGTYSLVFPGFVCAPDNNTCTVSYLWSVQGPVSGNGTGQTFSFNFSQAGTYVVTLIPTCGGKKCPLCRIVIKIEDPLPCSLSFSGKLQDKYCVGDQVTINWTGTTPPATVNLVLIDFTNWTVFQTIASGIPNSGSYTWTLPAGLPCDPERKWCFYVTDPSSTPQCWNYSSEFIIGCCHDLPCDCGTWGPIMINRIKYDCGGKMEWKCNQLINFSDIYQCSPNNESCQAKTKWEVTRDGSAINSGSGTSGSFTPTTNGIYTVTLYANCNGKDCPTCTYTFVVSGCPSTCDCGIWGPIMINRVKHDCGSKMEWKCNQPINFSDTYQCSPNNESCQAKTKWEVTRDGSAINSGSGTSGSFTPTSNGIYTVTLYANCNGKDCPTCTYTFVVSGCPPICDCGTWGLIMINRVKHDCGSKMEWKCNQPINFSDTYQCSPNNESCQAKTKWEVTRDGSAINSGSGASGSFTPASNGVYTITLYANCNGKDCPTCTYTFVVKDCLPTCECGKWIDSVVKIETGGAIISRVKCDGTASLGKGIYNFVFPGFVCAPDNNTCTVSYLWSVQGPVSGNGTGQTFSFNFTQAGSYTVTLTPICGGKKCPPCKIVIKIEDPLPCSLSFSGALKDKYCVGDQVTINWTGTTPPNTVNLVLIDFTNWTVFQTIASGIPNSGSYTWALPAGLPCDPERKWCFYVTDPSSTPQCWNYSSEFIIGCCHDTQCDCGTWDQLIVKQANGRVIGYDCGSKILIPGYCNQPFNFSNTFHCKPDNESCQAKTTWEIKMADGSIQTGSGPTGTFTPTANGTYTITLNATCNGIQCKPCINTIVVKDCHTTDCAYCKDNLGVTITNDHLSTTNNNSNEGVLSGSISGLDPTKIKKITIELVYFNTEQTNDPECANCAENQSWGNFSPPANTGFNGFGAPVLNSGNFGRLWTWLSKTDKGCDDGTSGGGANPGNSNNSPGNGADKNHLTTNPSGNSFSLPISLPPCGDKIKICIRYTFYDFCCHACEVIKCYEIERKTVKSNSNK